VTGFAPLVLASVTATIVSQAWFGNVAAFTVPAYHITSYLEIPAFALLGVIAAGVAILFQAALVGADWLARKGPLPLVARPAVGGLIIGAIAIWFPQVLGVGYDTTDAALNGRLTATAMIVLIVVKTAATGIALASRFGGGIFSPTLYLGALTGGAFGLIATGVFPDAGSSEGLYAILGMGAVAAAVLGAPISTTVMVFELTGGFALSLALLLAVSIANGLSQAVLGRSFFQAQLEARGIIPDRDPYGGAMREIRVADFMEPRADGAPAARGADDQTPVLRPHDTLATALRAFDTSGKRDLDVVDPADGTKIVGTTSQATALAHLYRALGDHKEAPV
jgi:chloride channel protein, CIC family